MELNEIYTISYSQPLDYHFSLDSIFLSQKINQWLLENNVTVKNVVDMCAGSGVVGLELLFHLSKRNSTPQKIDFVEIQKDYIEHFEKNKKSMQILLKDSSELNLIIGNYEKMIDDPIHQSVADLIVCNPPYFHLGQGKLSPSEFKNRCRYFVDSDFNHLLKWFKSALKPDGSAFFLVRTENSITLEAIHKLAHQQGLVLQVLGDIRGSEFIRATRLNPT